MVDSQEMETHAATEAEQNMMPMQQGPSQEQIAQVVELVKNNRSLIHTLSDALITSELFLSVNVALPAVYELFANTPTLAPFVKQNPSAIELAGLLQHFGMAEFNNNAPIAISNYAKLIEAHNLAAAHASQESQEKFHEFMNTIYLANISVAFAGENGEVIDHITYKVKEGDKLRTRVFDVPKVIESYLDYAEIYDTLGYGLPLPEKAEEAEETPADVEPESEVAPENEETSPESEVVSEGEEAVVEKDVTE